MEESANSSIVVSCIIFPNNLVYWDVFLHSLANQKSAPDFELIIFNDQCSESDLLPSIRETNLPYRIIPISGSIQKNRENMVNYFVKEKYEKIIFLDTDDLIPENYLMILTSKLEESEAVVCDITLVNEKAQVMSRNIWSPRLKNNQLLDRSDILNYNCFGLGNSAIRKSMLKEITIPENVIAVDWYLFYVLLENKNFLFTNETSLLYRQHSNNIQGIKTISKDQLINTNRVKIEHYKSLNKTIGGFDKNLAQELKIADFLNKGINYDKVSNLLNNEKNYYFWWEETYLLRELI